MPEAMVRRQGACSVRKVDSQGRGAGMAQMGCRVRSALALKPIRAVCSVLVLGLGLYLPSHLEAAKLSQYLTSRDLSRPVLLDQNGTQLQLPSPSHPHPSLPQGSTPTYLALPLYGGEHLPVGITTIDPQAQAGSNSMGPLGFNTMVKAELNNALNASGLALVDMPHQNYLVEYLPHITRNHRQPTGGSGATVASSSTNNGNATNTSNSSLSKLFTASQWDKWANSGLSDLKNLLNVNSSNSKNPTSKHNIVIQAQVLEPGGQTSDPGRVLPSPVPEPSGWMIFALLLGTAGLGYSVRHRHRHTTA